MVKNSQNVSQSKTVEIPENSRNYQHEQKSKAIEIANKSKNSENNSISNRDFTLSSILQGTIMSLAQ